MAPAESLREICTDCLLGDDGRLDVEEDDDSEDDLTSFLIVSLEKFNLDVS